MIGTRRGESGGRANFICTGIHNIQIYMTKHCQAPAELRAFALNNGTLKHESVIRVASYN